MKEKDLLFGDLLKQIRQSRNLSYRGLANLCNVSSTYIYDMEKNNRKVSLEIINILKDVLILTEEEKKLIRNAYINDRNTLPNELIEYIINNNLVDVLLDISKVDKNGNKIKSLILKDE